MPIDEHLEDLKRLKDRIREHFDCWYELLLLHNWRLHIQYEYERCKETPKTAARACVQWEYLTATIIFYLPQLLDSVEELEEIVVHELMHVFLNEMREFDDSRPDSIVHEERIATVLQRAFSHTRSKPVEAMPQKSGSKRHRGGR